MKRVLITGGARGIGLAIAEEFAREGAELVLTDLDRDALDTGRETIEKRGARCRTYVMDVTDPASVAATRERLASEAGAIDVLVNNAGVVYGGPFLDLPLERHLQTLRVNLEGAVIVTHAFLPDVLEAPRGHLVFIASASGFVGLPNGTTYAASKWGAIGFAESIRAELAHRDVRHVHVTTVCPGYVDTGLFAGAKPPKTTQMLRPDELAEKVVRAVDKGKVWVLEPWLIKLTPLLKNALPTPVADYLSTVFGAAQSMDDWTGRASDRKP